MDEAALAGVALAMLHPTCSALGPITIEPAFWRARCYCLSDPGDIALVVGCASGARKMTTGTPGLYSGATLT